MVAPDQVSGRWVCVRFCVIVLIGLITRIDLAFHIKWGNTGVGNLEAVMSWGRNSLFNTDGSLSVF
jgi:hypothetical protein